MAPTSQTVNTLTGRPVFERTPVELLPDPDPTEFFCPVISVDDHVIEPPTLFKDRIPAAMKDRAPTIEIGQDGVPLWSIAGALIPITAVDGACGRPIEQWVTAPQKFEEFRSGAVDPKARLSDMD